MNRKLIHLLLALGFLAVIGTARAALMDTYFGEGGVGGSAPPGSCSGTIDLSKGCALPMLGGL